MREFLITKFVCAECGKNLKITYEVPKSAGQYADGQPTGADMVEQVVAIEPCDCVTLKLEKYRGAVKTLLDV